MVGATLAYDQQNFSVDGAYTSGKLNTVTGGAYLGLATDGLRLNADLLYGNVSTDYARSSFVPGQTETARGRYDAHALSSRGGAVLPARSWPGSVCSRSAARR